MLVVVSSPDEERAEALRAELREAGHEVIDQNVGDTVVETDVVVLAARTSRLADTVTLAKATAGAVLLFGPLDVMEDLPDQVDQIAIEPLVPGEIPARVQHIERLAKRVTRAQLYAAAIESSGDIVEIAGDDVRLIYVNPAYERTFGYSRKEVLGKFPAELIRSEHHGPEFYAEIDATMRAGQPWQGIIVSKARSGELVYCEAVSAPIFDKDGELTHFICVRRNISNRMRREEELRRTNEELASARDEALAANRAKSQFLANMSHELRTPLNAIIGYSEMLAEDALDVPGAEDFVGDLQKIQSAGRHLLGLINDVLDLSKIEAGKMELFLEDFDLDEMVAQVTGTMQPLFAERGNELVVDQRVEVGEMHADLTKVRQTLLNLLSNANKFTDRAKVWLRVRAEQGWLRIQVQDSGIGMSDEQVERLFQPFTQADASTTRKYGGTGLGLAISQRFCEMMGGRIRVQSELGKGSTFTVRLPLEVRERRRRRKISVSPAGAEHTVLVVDDDETVHDLLLRALSKRGYRVHCISHGDRVVESALELEPHVIVLDVMMPGTDGWSALAALKADARTRDVPVVMHTIVNQQELGYALGAVDYVVKPVEPARLVDIVTQHVGRAKKRSVLVVEDDPASRELVCRTVRSAGYDVLEAENGRVAIERLRQQVPGLIVLDLMMPEIDGFGVLEHVAQDARLADVPVVVVTAKTLDAGEREHLHRAAKRVFRKGEYTREQLLEEITRRVGDAVKRTPQRPKT